jgi:hypothetical protein
MVSGVIRKDEVDMIFAGKLYQVLYALAGLGIGAGAMWGLNKRKPSMDATMSDQDSRIEALEGGQRLIFKKLDQIIETNSGLRSGQAANTANIDDIKSTVHTMQQQLQSMNNHMLTMNHERHAKR